MIVVEMMPKQEGRNMVMVISPNKRHMEQLAREAARGASLDGPAVDEASATVEPAPASDEG